MRYEESELNQLDIFTVIEEFNSVKNNSGVGIIIDYSKDYTVGKGVYTFSTFFSFFSAILHISICKMREMTSFSMKSFHFDLNAAARYVDMALTLLAS